MLSPLSLPRIPAPVLTFEISSRVEGEGGGVPLFCMP